MTGSIKAILFDYDDTLVNTRGTVYQAHKIAAKKYYDLNLTDELIEPHWGKPYPVMLTGMYQNLDTFEALNANYMTVRRDYPMQIFPDTLPTINLLLKDYALGILTAANLELIQFDLETLKFPIDQFALIQTSDDTEVHKPDPKVFDPALKKLQTQHIQPNETLYVGDALTDYQAASGAGLQFIGIVRNSHNPFAGLNIRTIESLNELRLN
jgi:FMN phosphatase YigB (HAD superfamily)